jgi:hypothetical protein
MTRSAIPAYSWFPSTGRRPYLVPRGPPGRRQCGPEAGELRPASDTGPGFTAIAWAARARRSTSLVQATAAEVFPRFGGPPPNRRMAPRSAWSAASGVPRASDLALRRGRSGRGPRSHLKAWPTPLPRPTSQTIRSPKRQRRTRECHQNETRSSGACMAWRGPESNRRHHGFQPCALPTELPRLDGPV